MTQELHPVAVTEIGPVAGSPATPPSATSPDRPADHGRGGGTAHRVGGGAGRSRRIPFGWPRTLTARLVIGVVTLVVVIVIAIGAVTYFRQQAFLYSRLDQQVNAQADQTRDSTGPDNPFFTCDPSVTVCTIKPGRRFGGTEQAEQAQWLVFLSPAGDVRSRIDASYSSDLRELNLSAATRRDLVSSGPGLHTVTTTDGQQIRVTTRAADGFVIVSGISTAEVDDTLHQLLIAELLIGSAGILLAALLTAGGMYFGLAPLKRVTRTAQEVTAELSPDGAGLDRRVPETDSTTEVGQLAMSFNTMLNTVETEFRARRESEERMRQFLADASHELRTPLTSIRGYAELARMQNARSGLATSEDDSLNRIELEGTRMSRLVEDLLTLARGDDADDTTPVEREAIDVGDLVGDVVAGVHVAHPDRVLEQSVDAGLTLWGDHNQILRALRNLATNAAVHTDPAGVIRIEGHREAGNVVLQVIDQGPGLPPEEAQHVFERFWRADKARTRVRGGSGLGMAIVDQIVQSHGGQIYFDSSVADGTTVTVVVPGGAG